MSKDLYVYPRGFITTYTNSAPEDIDNSKLLKTTDGKSVVYINGVYGLEAIFIAKSTYLDIVLKAIALTSRLFGDDFNKWLDLQLTSPTISTECLTFLEDTVSFIKTGKRIVPVESNQRIIRDVELNRYNTEKLKYVVDTKFEDSNVVTVLCQWLAQPDGLKDLRHSLEIMFGDERIVERVHTIQPNPGAMYFK